MAPASMVSTACRDTRTWLPQTDPSGQQHHCFQLLSPSGTPPCWPASPSSWQSPAAADRMLGELQQPSLHTPPAGGGRHRAGLNRRTASCCCTAHLPQHAALTANSGSVVSLLSDAFLGFPAAADAVLLFFAGPAEGCTNTPRVKMAVFSREDPKVSSSSPCWKHSGASWLEQRIWAELQPPEEELWTPSSCQLPQLRRPSFLQEAPPSLHTL